MRSKTGVTAWAFLIAACSGAGHFQPFSTQSGLAARPRVITNIDFVGAGDQEAARFVREMPEADRTEVQAAIARAAAACVRIEVRRNISSSGYEANKGCGVLVQGAKPGDPIRLGSAGHVLDMAASYVCVVTTTGREITVNSPKVQFVRGGSSAQDWAVLQIDNAVDLPTVPLASPKNGDLAFLLAYPDGIGRDAAGRFAYNKARENEPLLPLLTVAEVVQVSPLELRPLAGAVPLGGASGGAIVNRRGELIGLFNAVRHSLQANGVTYWLLGAESDAIGAAQGR